MTASGCGYWSVHQMTVDMLRAVDSLESALEYHAHPGAAAFDLSIGRFFLSCANDIAVELRLFSGRVL